MYYEQNVLLKYTLLIPIIFIGINVIVVMSSVADVTKFVTFWLVCPLNLTIFCMFLRNIPQEPCLKMAFSIFILKSSARYVCSACLCPYVCLMFAAVIENWKFWFELFKLYFRRLDWSILRLVYWISARYGNEVVLLHKYNCSYCYHLVQHVDILRYYKSKVKSSSKWVNYGMLLWYPASFSSSVCLVGVLMIPRI